MKEWMGTLEYVDLGSGGWRLVLADGQALELYGQIPEKMAGKQVRVTGSLEAHHGFMMTGDQTVEVQTIQLV